TMTDAGALEAELDTIVEQGFGFDRGEYLEGMIAIAVPVINLQGQAIMALAIHAPSVRKSLDELRQYLPVLRRAAGQMAEGECGNDRPAGV
ncbi:MAG: IclR family transcriptional regulator, partial [uncultured Thiotrichaceae bacterium]